MGGFNEIATSGSPALVSLLGIGTVFISLTILYLLMLLMSRIIPLLAPSREKLEQSEPTLAVAGQHAEETAEVKGRPSADEGEIAAAIAVALTRHRYAPREIQQGAVIEDPWRVTGRLGNLRKR